MSTLSAAQTVVDHVVLFKVKDNTDPSKVNEWVNGLNSLSSLGLTLHLTAGPLLRIRSSPIAFTHLLYSRYSSKENLAAYALHPAHVAVVKEGLSLCEDIMAVDWIADMLPGPTKGLLSPGSAISITTMKLKEEFEEEGRREVLETIKGKFGEVGKIISFGENFSPARAKGYSIASVEEMETTEEEVAVVVEKDDKVKEYVDNVIVVDYVVIPSSPESASV